jgi:hypothetical protein
MFDLLVLAQTGNLAFSINVAVMLADALLDDFRGAV